MAETAAIAGFRSHLRVSADDVTYYSLKEIVNLNPSSVMNVISASNHDSTFNEKIEGKRDWSITGEHNYIYDDPAWVILRDAHFAGTKVYVKIMPKETIGMEKFTGKCIVASTLPVGPDNAPATVPLNLQGSSDLTAGTIVAGDIA